MSASSKLSELRRLLAERFPESARIPGRTLALGIPELDRATGGGLPLGAITEVVCASPSCGGHSLLAQALAVTRANRSRVALIDAIDAFDPASYPADLLAHLIWIRCHDAQDALQAADVVARDANFTLVALDLRGSAQAALRRIPATTWYRLQRAVEPADLSLLILTSQSMIPSAHVRLELARPHALPALRRETGALRESLAPSLHRQRMAR